MFDLRSVLTEGRNGENVRGSSRPSNSLGVNSATQLLGEWAIPLRRVMGAGDASSIIVFWTCPHIS
jgi:hypothetical protein